MGDLQNVIVFIDYKFEQSLKLFKINKTESIVRI